MKKNTNNLLRQISLQTLAVTVLFVSSLLIFTHIADENVLENNNVFDNEVIVYVAAHSTPLLIRVMEIITFFGSMQFLLPAYILLILYFFLKRNYVYAIDIAIIASTSTGAMYLLKQLFKRHRPDLPVVESANGYSFPSGHSMSSFIFCTIIAYILWVSPGKKNWKYVVTFLVVLFSITIGLSRIILNVHYATDVMAGFCLGIIWVLLSFWLIRKIRRKSTPDAI